MVVSKDEMWAGQMVALKALLVVAETDDLLVEMKAYGKAELKVVEMVFLKVEGLVECLEPSQVV